MTPKKPVHVLTVRLTLPRDMTQRQVLFLAKAALRRQFPNRIVRVNITNDQPPKETPNA